MATASDATAGVARSGGSAAAGRALDSAPVRVGRIEFVN